MIDIYAEADRLLLTYAPNDSGTQWVRQKFRSGENIHARHVFSLKESDLVDPLTEYGQDHPEQDDEDFVFVIGHRVDDYFRLDKSVMDTKNAFSFHESIPLSTKLLIASRDISILRKFDRLVSQDVYIGGNRTDSMPIEAYMRLVKTFPNSHEQTRYVEARISACIRDYLDTTKDAVSAYEKYMDGKPSRRGASVTQKFRQSELAKFRALLAKLEDMLAHEADYNEQGWQTEILEVILLLYPKYLQVFEKVRVSDTINHTHREIDLLLVDSAGSVDLIEIKRPFGDASIVSRATYRDNYLPWRELSGAIMQIEKYVLYLNRWGQQGEGELSKRFADRLPKGLRLHIVNPKGIVIMGREHGLSGAQLADFEVIKRKYANIVDIVTYDDLLRRLRRTVQALELT